MNAKIYRSFWLRKIEITILILFFAFGNVVLAQIDSSSDVLESVEDAYAEAERFDYQTGNEAWTPVTMGFDGTSMVLVPPGCFLMGTSEADLSQIGQLRQDGQSLFINESPQHEICFDKPFWFDQFEVTQEQFASLEGAMNAAPAFIGELRPVENITWFEALNFCRSRGARLPSEAEWEYAARGPDNLIYPWGNALNDSNMLSSETVPSGTPNVGSNPNDRSWVGAIDLTGSVEEWVSSLFMPYPFDVLDGREAITNRGENRVFRGGTFATNNSSRVRSAARYWSPPEFRTAGYGGFRCARSMNPLEGAVNNGDETAARACLAPPVSSNEIPINISIGQANQFDYFQGNQSWTPVAHNFDGVPMVLVPPGCFTMGTPQAEAEALLSEYGVYYHSEETPAHQQCISEPFWLDQMEVTQAQLMRVNNVSIYDSNFICNQRPVEHVSWFDAVEFCAMRGGRLATETEWEYAARGPDNLIYPWGNEFLPENAIWDENRPQNTWLADAGSIPEGTSWVGALDMSGNMLEWTSSLYQPYPYSSADGREDPTAEGYRVLRGGGWDHGLALLLRSASRTFQFPSGAHFTGFRCARSIDTTH